MKDLKGLSKLYMFTVLILILAGIIFLIGGYNNNDIQALEKSRSYLLRSIFFILIPFAFTDNKHNKENLN